MIRYVIHKVTYPSGHNHTTLQNYINYILGEPRAYYRKLVCRGKNSGRGEAESTIYVSAY